MTYSLIGLSGQIHLVGTDYLIGLGSLITAVTADAVGLMEYLVLELDLTEDEVLSWIHHFNHQ